MNVFFELQRRVLELLHASTLRGESLDLATISAALRGSPEHLIDKSLYGLRSRGLVTFLEVLGENGLRDIELTARGLEHVEADRTRGHASDATAKTVLVTGGNVQIGDNNIQRVRGRR